MSRKYQGKVNAYAEEVMKFFDASKETLDKIIELYNIGFNFNAKCDRLSYVLSVSMNYPSLGNFVHKQFAHRIVGDDFADKIEEYGELRHDLFYRDALPVHVESFDSISQLFEDLVLEVADIQNRCEVVPSVQRHRV